MKLLYNASNSIEGHMILNLLEQEGLRARIDGEYLQGGVGELQAIGLVRVLVEEDDYETAKKIVDRWDERQPEAIPAPARVKGSPSFGSALIGFFVGAIAVAIFYRTPITTDGIDYNGDGKLDEKWTYSGQRISKIEIDRNRDGDVDSIIDYDQAGLIKKLITDDNFDAIFEAETRFKHGNRIAYEADTTGDGFKDYHIYFKHDVWTRAEFYDPKSRRRVKVQNFDITLKSAEIDENGDGILDTRHTYNHLEEITSTTRQ